MSTRAVARVYAETLLRQAEHDDAVDAVADGIEIVVGALDAEPRLSEFLEAPQISADAKHALIDRVFGSRVHPIVTRFLKLVVDRHREPLLGHIARAWSVLVDERANRQTAVVATAQAIDDATRTALKRALESATGKHITIEERIEPDLLGGIVVRTGDLVMDGSLRSRLEQVERRLRSDAQTH